MERAVDDVGQLAPGELGDEREQGETGMTLTLRRRARIAR